MMFFNTIKTEPTPERVFSISRIVLDKAPIDEKKLESILVPEKLNTANNSYFRPVFETAKELKLIGYDEDKNVIFTGIKDNIKDMQSFRRYCNSFVFSDPSTDFYKIIGSFLSSNDEWWKYGSVTTSDEVIKLLYNLTGISSNKLEKDVILGIRFWINFLGFGYFQENAKIFLPNMYVALKDFMFLGNVEAGKEYAVEEFVDSLYNGSLVALKNSRDSMSFNLAFSNALRLMHDNKEIQLERISDSEKIWHMFPNNEHEFTSDITHIIIKQAVK